VLLQPTQPFRKPEHVQQAIQLLQETQADSVVSVVPLPLTHSPDARGEGVMASQVGSIRLATMGIGASREV
jgi:CMP-N-acetylneuraminic acid synthetase